MNRNYQRRYAYPQRDIMLAGAKIKYLMFNVKGKAMDKVRYKTGIGRNSLPLRSHNNEWQRSSLNRQMPSFSACHPEQTGNYMSWREENFYNQFNEHCPSDTHYQQNYCRQPDRESYQNNQSTDVYPGNTCWDQTHKECNQADEDSSSQSSVSDHSSETLDPGNSKHAEDISKGVGSKTKSSMKTSRATDHQSHTSQSNQNDGISRKRSYATAMGADSGLLTTQNISAPKVKKNSASITKEVPFIQNAKADTVIDLTGDEELQTLKCDLCDFIVPPDAGSKSLKEVMSQHFKQFKHNSSSLVKVTEDKNKTSKLICVVSESYFTVPANSHICMTNITIPMCPKKGCHSIFETVWLCAKHYQVFHDESVENCYGLGKVVQRKLATCLIENNCEKCGKEFQTPKGLHKHWNTTNHHPVSIPNYPEMCIYFCRYCDDMYNTLAMCRLHSVGNHRPREDKIAVDVIYVHCPTSQLFLPPVESKSLTYNINKEIALLLGIKHARYWGNGIILKRFRKKIDEKIREMRKLRRASR